MATAVLSGLAKAAAMAGGEALVRKGYDALSKTKVGKKVGAFKKQVEDDIVTMGRSSQGKRRESRQNSSAGKTVARMGGFSNKHIKQYRQDVEDTGGTNVSKPYRRPQKKLKKPPPPPVAEEYEE